MFKVEGILALQLNSQYVLAASITWQYDQKVFSECEAKVTD